MLLTYVCLIWVWPFSAHCPHQYDIYHLYPRYCKPFALPAPAFLQQESCFLRNSLFSFSCVLQRNDCLAALKASRKQLEKIPKRHLLVSLSITGQWSHSYPSCLQKPSLKQYFDTKLMFSTQNSLWERRGKSCEWLGQSSSQFFSCKKSGVHPIKQINLLPPWDLARTEVRIKGSPLAIKGFHFLGISTVTEQTLVFLPGLLPCIGY